MDGNQHIASEFAILKLAKIISIFRVKNVLEVGLGIGSIAGSILESTNSHKISLYAGVENNAYCLNSLPANLGSHYKRLKVLPNLISVPGKNIYDLIIIDGKDEKIENIQSLISNHGIIAIEGDRLSQQKILQTLFPRQIYVHTISTEKNKSYSPFPKEHWQGGLKIIFVRPTTLQYLWWIKEKIFTKLKYIYRRNKV